ncbi:T9SS type A sorting domain-containing protein [uncultured Marixanthomonas sp.]|uniref:T9SS type A sorting domain-containing protein n=1 Tax=uncultured Marixanthomonas sp. TaxID=757245 RepID=UPI0030DB0A5A|tara:strand:+ start:20634 stop:21494 length:861 start_codon:yes stop_codon:yes gene_type:complete
MKKITLALGALLVSFSGFSQNMIGNEADSNPQNIIQSSPQMDPCNQNVATNGLENGGLFGDQRLAIDIDVEADFTFSIEEIIPTFVGLPTNAEFVFRLDEGGLPGIEIFTVDAYTITDDVITGSNFGFDFHQITYTLDEAFELEGGETGRKYWMEIVTDADGWESSSVSSTGLLGAFNNEASGFEWTVGTTDYVYELNGDCSPTLSVNDSALSQVSVYPNPASDVLNIETPATVEVNSVAIYDVLGKRSNVSLVNGQVRVSDLANGVYILSLETNVGTLTQKIVKN